MNLYEKIKTKNSKIGVIGLGYVKCPPKSRHEIFNNPNSSFH